MKPELAWPFVELPHGQQFAPANSKATAEAATRESVLAVGLQPIRVEGLAPKDLAMAVVATVGDDTSIASRADINELASAAFGEIGTYEGIYFELQDEAGEILFVLARSYRTGDGWSFASPALGFEPLRAVPTDLGE